jgi:hypothetical protein
MTTSYHKIIASPTSLEELTWMPMQQPRVVSTDDQTQYLCGRAKNILLTNFTMHKLNWLSKLSTAWIRGTRALHPTSSVRCRSRSSDPAAATL